MKDKQVDYDMVVRLLGGLYISLAYAMPDANHRVAHDILMGFADNPDLRPEDRRAYRLLALIGGRQGEDEPLQRSRHFEVITGGNSAA